MNPEDRDIRAEAEITLNITVRINLEESEIADIMGCEVHELIDKDEKEIEEKLEEYGSYNWEDYTSWSEIDSTDVDLEIREELPEEETKEEETEETN
jgi:hypothetical protein